MNTATPQRSAPRPIKGSWEDLYAQAQQLARNYNDEAIPLYQRVFKGLMALPPAARAAGDNRLYNLMMTTGVELQGYLNLNDRYDESLAVVDKMLNVVAEVDKPQIIELKSDVLLQADRGEEAIAVLRALAESEDADAGDWGSIIAGYIRMKQADKALPVVDEMGKWIDTKVAAGVLRGQEITDARYYQERLRAAALLELGRFDQATALFNALFAIGGTEAFSPHLLYTRLVQDGRYAEALRFIDRDQSRPVRAAFWRGLVTRYMGDPAKATRIWEAALKEEVVRGDTESIVEHILTLYYLGDPKGEGVEVMLRAQREQTRISWMIFLLTGLGWIVRKDYNAAHSNIRLALAQVKSMGEGKTLPHQYWRFMQDLTPADQVAQFAQYFDTHAKTSAASQEDSAQEPAANQTATDTPATETEE
jgi:tetratricopeptide (TPR) repeat protein